MPDAQTPRGGSTAAGGDVGKRPGARDPRLPGSPAQEREPSRQSGILGRVLDLLAGSDESERTRKKLLREYARKVARWRPRLYNPRARVADAALGTLFHTYYRTLGPARILLRNAKLSAVLKTVAVERCLQESQREVLLALREEALVARSKTVGAKELVQLVRDELGVLAKGFDRKSVDRAGRAYRAVLHLVDLVSFDYWGVLRRFDARYPETDFTYTPRMFPVDATHVVESLKDFVEVLAPMDPELEWKEALGILRDYRGMDLISPDGWNQLLRTTAELRRSGILLAIVRLMDEDISYAPRSRVPKGQIVEAYVETVRKQTETVLRKVLESQRQQSVDVLMKQVFGEASPPGLQNYAPALSEKLTRKNLPGLGHTAALGYARAYLADLHTTRVKELVDALLIRATWKDAVMSRTLSDTYQDLLSVLPDVVALDQRLGDNQDLGVRLRGALARADRAKPQTLAQGRQIIQSIEKQAAGLVTRAIQGCGSLGQIFRTLVEDSGQPAPKVVLNWKDLKGTTAREDVRGQLVESFRRLQAVAQLLRLTTNRPVTAGADSAAQEAVQAAPPGDAAAAEDAGGPLPVAPGEDRMPE